MTVADVQQQHIIGLITSFASLDKREELLRLAEDPAKHGDLLALLFHRGTLGTHWARKVTSGRDTHTIEQLLHASGSGGQCVVISTSPDADGQCLPLAEALEKYVGSGSTLIISCSPGELVYFEDDSTDERYVFSTRDGTASFF
ncbi:hypothetical protein [Natronoglycomyces albus]|uniref:Uncharacterized protein n=1 Tax=Natronoglycomyces albus TaxID=2811108 RepID=A0A895XNS4_9ACTN|nr:hypothetical protein [Natronoglycomyces albus]QSB04146.1 hypothetical protein JQS30_10005 [Natronoglycomyces albus]